MTEPEARAFEEFKSNFLKSTADIEYSPNIIIGNKLHLVLEAPFDGLRVELVTNQENQAWKDFALRKKFGDIILFPELFEVSPCIDLKVNLKGDLFADKFGALVRLKEESFFRILKELKHAIEPGEDELLLSEIPESVLGDINNDNCAFADSSLIFKIPGTDKILVFGVEGLKVTGKKHYGRIPFERLADAKIVSVKISDILDLQHLYNRFWFSADRLAKITDPDGKEYYLPCTVENMEFLKTELPGFAMEDASVYSLLESILQPVK